MVKHHSPRFLNLVEEARRQIVECTVHDLRARLERGETFHLLDVREESEFARGRIPGATHLGRGIIERDIEKLIPDENAPIVFYCGGGYRSALAACNLVRMGYRKVVSMDGGFRGWTEAGYEIET